MGPNTDIDSLTQQFETDWGGSRHLVSHRRAIK